MNLDLLPKWKYLDDVFWGLALDEVLESKKAKEIHPWLFRIAFKEEARLVKKHLHIEVYFCFLMSVYLNPIILY